MISDAVLSLFLSIFTSVTALVPADWSIDTEAFETATAGIWAGAGGWNNWLPIVHILACFALLFGAGVSVSMYRFARSIWDALPFT